MDNLAAVTKATSLMNTARTHAEAHRESMGSAWADELIAWHEANTREAVATYMSESKCDSAELRQKIESNLLAEAGL